MSESDAAIRSAVGRADFQSLLQSETGPQIFPWKPRPPSGEPIWLSLRKTVSFPVVMAFILAGSVLVGVPLRLPDPDTWWHIAVGQHILDARVA